MSGDLKELSHLIDKANMDQMKNLSVKTMKMIVIVFQEVRPEKFKLVGLCFDPEGTAGSLEEQQQELRKNIGGVSMTLVAQHTGWKDRTGVPVTPQRLCTVIAVASGGCKKHGIRFTSAVEKMLNKKGWWKRN